VPDIPQEWLEDIKETLARYVPNVEVRAFGSRVTGKAKKYSDLDLVLMTQSPLNAATMAFLENAFEESDLPIKVDVVEWATISDSFRRIIEEKFEVI
jgi:predicted nucleotidyltransferase